MSVVFEYLSSLSSYSFQNKVYISLLRNKANRKFEQISNYHEI